MSAAHRRLAPPSWLRLPRRTARLRLTALYGGLFLVSGVALLAATYALFERATEYKTPQLPKVPRTPSIQNVQILPTGSTIRIAQKPSGLSQAQQYLVQAQHELAYAKPSSLVFVGPPRLGQIQSQLTHAQNQLAQGQHQLAQAVHQLAQVGSAQAVQRAVDLHQLLINSGIALAVVAVLALLAGWLVAGRMLRPIRTITRAARRISSTNLHERLALGGPDDELKELGDTLDDLFGRLDAAFIAQRQFVANASHELRTPLTAERALLQVALDDPDTTIPTWRSAAEEVLASNQEQERLIEALLDLASSESGLDDPEALDLSMVASVALNFPRPDIDRLRLSVHVSLTPASIEGDPTLIERLVVNLLDNAVRHNVAGGRIEMVTGVDDGMAVLSVTNTGWVIPPAEVDRLFQPFQRLDPRRIHHNAGHGLGLSIVRTVADAHRAIIVAVPLPSGGLSIKVSFPQLARSGKEGTDGLDPQVADRLRTANSV